ncbi:hypothetical protein B6U99_02795 [Candidatus Geothermarchaeota archaeon ex4572_27]|nr:MAG: hypothetical protein B6U99_02795 [Candidatus Geothermarchaeota archaeon ex4572_27]
MPSLMDVAITFILAALPVSEVRGAIPYGLLRGLDPILVLLISFAGNVLPIPPLLALLKVAEGAVARLASREGALSIVARAYISYASRARERVRPYVGRYGALGLALFTATPLPFTGAWTSALAAHVLGMDARLAAASIAAGVALAGIIVEALMGALMAAWPL